MRTTQEAKQFWDDRYSSGNYIYGTQPNRYFKGQLDKLEPGKLLLPAEGEGRNGIYAAREGWSVDAFDISEKGRKKALELAKRNHVSINYHLNNYEGFEIKEGFYDAIGLIYAQLHSTERSSIHKKLISGLKSGGCIILEAFTKEQIENDSGGPKDPEMLYDLDDLLQDFSEMDVQEADASEIDLQEGEHHEGTANVLQLVAQKK